MNIYIEMVVMLHNYIHFWGTGNCKGYSEVLFDFLLYCLRPNPQNYARTLSYYYVHMRALEEENIVVYKYLEQGGFSSSLTGKPHSRIPFNQVVDTIINRSCKEVGGLSRNTQNPGANEGWTKIHHHIVALREHIKKEKKRRLKKRHVKLRTARIEQDEKDVRNIITCINAWLPELWRKGHARTNFATGEIAMDDMRDNIIDLKERGEIARNEFVGRFTEESTKLNHYDPINRQPLKLFEKKTIKKKHSIPEDEDNRSLTFLQRTTKKKLICAK